MKLFNTYKKFLDKIYNVIIDRVEKRDIQNLFRCKGYNGENGKLKEKNFSDTIRKAQLLMQKERLDLILLQFCISNFCLSSKYKILESSEILELITDDNSITRIQPFLKTTDLFEKLNTELTIFKILGYGGGLFLPFFDMGCFSKGENYEGGRYLIDTIKGADLGECKKMNCDYFNFSYNPSCSYNSKWSCPIIKNYNNIPIFN